MFLFTATAVQFDTNVDTFEIELRGGLVFESGPSFLMRRGSYQLRASADNHYEIRRSIEVTEKDAQRFDLQFVPLPGRVSIATMPSEVTVVQDGEVRGSTPLTRSMDYGEQSILLRKDRYFDKQVEFFVEGKNIEQEFHFVLDPDFATLDIHSNPTSAEISIDGEILEKRTPGPIEIMSGEHLISVKLPGYKRWNDIIFVRPGEDISLDPINLQLVGGSLHITSRPANASVTIAGQYRGTTPVVTDLAADRPFQVDIQAATYHSQSRLVTLQPGEGKHIQFDLKPVTGEVAIITQPEAAEVWIDGKQIGYSNSTISLHAVEHHIALRKSGYASYETSITPVPDYPKELRVRLLTQDEARLEALKRARTTAQGQELVLFQPTAIQMGASRRQPGRRANENLRTANLARLFYLSKNEISNAEFRAFAAGHSSGDFENIDLDKDEQPVTNVSWVEATRYCNWLSHQDGLDPFYTHKATGDVITNPTALGYRLPTEAEWSWVARYQEDGDLLLYPWGNKLPPPNRHGNYADRAAQHVVGRVIFNYNDNHTVSAPIGTFDPNDKGIYDLGGNVAEWVHDFYEIPQSGSVVSVLGPDSGEYHVIRGSSWMHGSVTDLRLSFRDYGEDGRKDVGFRLARYAE